MNFTRNILLKNFSHSKKINLIKKNFQTIIRNPSEIIKSLKLNYKYSYSSQFLKKLNKNKCQINLIGMGGSVLGTKAIHSFLIHKIKKKITFIDNLNLSKKDISKKKNLNLIISKSGNTLETITNVNLHIKKKDKSVFITDNQNNYLRDLALKLKSEVIDHNNFIGGRYSVLSEVGMLPASLMGLSERKFKQFNNLLKNKNFIDHLCITVSNMIYFIKRKKYNSIIINYDEKSNDLFEWYKQLVAESLGKKNKGLFPIISTMPKDNHSVSQLYLDGPKNNFFTFFNVNENSPLKINKNLIFGNFQFLKKKKIEEILYSNKKALENIFFLKKIPFRSFQILRRNEETLGELFSFFILETILLGKMMKLNPFDQPAVELIKVENKKILLKN